MNFSKDTLTNTVEILATDNFRAVPIKVVVDENADTTIVKAGTPLTIGGEATTGANAAGILLYDVNTDLNPNGALLVDGIIDKVKAEAHSGITYASGLMAALNAAGCSIVMRENIGINE